VASDVWSLAITLMEGAIRQFPISQDLLLPIETLHYLVSHPIELKDEGTLGMRYSGSFKHFMKSGRDPGMVE